MIRRLRVCATTAVAIVLLAISGVAPGGAQATSNAGIDAPALLEESTSKPAIGVNFEPEHPLSPVSQQNAVRAAEDYLEISAFSRQGLIEQLEYGGFSTADATFAVDYITVELE